jgi:hypothetical protein
MKINMDYMGFYTGCLIYDTAYNLKHIWPIRGKKYGYGTKMELKKTKLVLF